MTEKKKLLSLFLCLLLVLSTISVATLPALAETEETDLPEFNYRDTIASDYDDDFVSDFFDEGDFSFRTLSDGTVEIVSMVETFETPTDLENFEIEIPKTADGKTVTSIGSYAFYDSYFVNVIIPDTITNIGSDAFEDCDSIGTITIPDSVETIGEYAFAWCENLASISIGSGVTSLSNDVFYYTAYYNNNKNWDDMVLYVDEYLVAVKNDFDEYYDEVLEDWFWEEITVEGDYQVKEGTKVISDLAFADCTELTSVTFPESLENIGVGAFEYCDSLTRVTIPASVKNIGFEAFWGCEALKSITVDADNTVYCDIDGVLFSKDKSELILYPSAISKASYVIPESVTAIADDAFGDCRSLETVTVGTNVDNLAKYTFSSCDSLKEITVDAANKNYSAADGVLFNKDKTKLVIYPAHKENTEYTVPSTVKNIGEFAFSGSINLTDITIPNNVEIIENNSFNYCYFLENVTIGNSVKAIEDYAFYNCVNIKTISIPDSVKTIGIYAFADCEKLESVSIGKGVETIGESAFNYTAYYNNESNWDDKVLYIDNCVIDTYYDFSWDYDEELDDYIMNEITLEGDYVIKDGTRLIADFAFSWCEKLTGITIPDSVKHIGDSAFYACGELDDISIGNGIISIGSSAFYFTGYFDNESNWDDTILYIDNYLVGTLRTWKDSYDEETDEYSNDLVQPEGDVTIKQGTKVICDYAFNDCTNLTSVTIPDSVKTIGDSAFYNCLRLKDIKIGSGVETIGDWAFAYNVLLTEVSIPSSVKAIRDFALYGCVSLEEITIPYTVEKIGEMAVGYYYTDDEKDSVKDSFVLKGYTGSAAEKYAVANKITFQSIGYAPDADPSNPTKPSSPTTTTCVHSTVVKNQKVASYFADGYAGDKVCVKCGKTVTNGTAIAKLKLSVPKFKVTAKSKKLIVKYTKVKNATGFQVRYRIGKGKWKIKTFNTKKSAKKLIKGLKKGKRYTVQVRSMITSGKQKAFSKWSKAKKYKVK